jgi:hypothetical protein
VSDLYCLVLFGGGYKESVIVDLSTTGAGATHTDKYDYGSDSDLESVSEDESEFDDVKHTSDAQHVLTDDAGEFSSVSGMFWFNEILTTAVMRLYIACATLARLLRT